MIGLDIIFWMFCLAVIFGIALRYAGFHTHEAILAATVIVIIMGPCYLTLAENSVKEKQLAERKIMMEKAIDKINSDIKSKSKYIYVDEAILNDSTDDTRDIIKGIVENGYVPISQVGQYKIYRREKKE